METVEEVIARKRKEREEANLVALRRDIYRAREVLLRRYPRYINEEETPTGFFDRAGYFDVTFPQPDKAVVTLVKFGELMSGTKMVFRLSWNRGMLFWGGNFAIRQEIYEEGDIVIFSAGYAEGKP